jgi:TorA maturation chaperone TorD
VPGPENLMSGNTELEAVSAARARAGLYELLATMFRAPLSAGSLRRFRSEEFADALRGAGMSMDDGFRLGDEKALLGTLAVDFTQLFHGPRQHRVANESVQTGGGEGTLNGDATVAVQEFYCSAGLYYDETQSELPDHISVELAAMVALARAEAEARDASDRLDVRQRVHHQAEFLATHLGWAIDLGRWVAWRARTPFYREAGHLLAEFLQADAAELTRTTRVSARAENFIDTPVDGEKNHARTETV